MAAIVASVLPVVVDQEYLLLTTDPTDLAAAADNGRRAEPAPDGVPTEWWRFGWWVRSGPERARPTPSPEPKVAGPAVTSGRTKEDAEPVAAASGGRLGVPATVLSAYRRAAARVRVLDPACGLSWEMLAGIGKIESGHAWGGYVTSRGDTVRPILGPQLDGSRYAAISDTDGGRLDGDTQWDRAVGPMQFIPSSWEHFAADGNADGTKNPHNVFDAALASGLYLCVGQGDLSRSGDLREALYRYNHSTSYVQSVYAWILAYRQGGATATAADVSQVRAVGGGGDPSSPGRQSPEPTASPRPTGQPNPGGPGPGGPAPGEPAPGEPAPGEPAPGDPGEPGPEDPGPGPSPDPTPAPGPTPSPWCPVESLPVCVELPPLDLGLDLDGEGAAHPDQ
ncbi:lytic transglycosylase domain-containing protein [Actinopolymorpha sp. B17G11]|uniref:lytic transglycosylase domain-containing protein n=1 Tax=Actinopolymorpha sp. B17G11 TaxID=3160861 RepID=UPI0032E483F7